MQFKERTEFLHRRFGYIPNFSVQKNTAWQDKIYCEYKPSSKEPCMAEVRQTIGYWVGESKTRERKANKKSSCCNSTHSSPEVQSRCVKVTEDDCLLPRGERNPPPPYHGPTSEQRAEPTAPSSPPLPDLDTPDEAEDDKKPLLLKTEKSPSETATKPKRQILKPTSALKPQTS